MGAPFLNYDPTAGEAPPQAPAPVATLADMATPTPAPLPSPTDDLRRAAYGDQGAANYDALVQAGARRPAAGIAGMAGVPVAPEGGLPGGTSGGVPGDLTQLFGDVLLGPKDATQAANARQLLAQRQQTMQLAAEKDQRDNAAEFYTQLMPKIFEAFPGRPDLAAQMLDSAAAKRGLTVDPAVLINLNQRQKDGTLPRGQVHSIMTNPATSLDVIARFGASTKAADEAISHAAAADAAIDNAEKAHTEAVAAPAKVADAATNAALETARRLQALNMPAKEDELERLDAAGWTRWRVPAPGAKGGETMWTYGPKSDAPPGMRDAVTNALTRMRAGKAGEAAQTALAKEEATTTSNTRGMKEKAPKVIALADEVEGYLKQIQTGPFASRFQDFMSGKIGAPNPVFKAYKDNAVLLGSLLMNMHVGARGGEYIGKKFDEMIGANRESAENMQSTLNVIRKYSNIVLHSGVGSEVPTTGLGGEGAPGATPAPSGTPTPGAEAAPAIPGLRPGFSVSFE